MLPSPALAHAAMDTMQLCGLCAPSALPAQPGNAFSSAAEAGGAGVGGRGSSDGTDAVQGPATSGGPPGDLWPPRHESFEAACDALFKRLQVCRPVWVVDLVPYAAHLCPDLAMCLGCCAAI